jgi:glutamate 5-kinase
MTAVCVSADLLVLLSDIDGLYTANPRTDANAKLISTVNEITPEILSLAEGKGSELSTGGMTTKLRAASSCMASGVDIIIANGGNPELLYDIADGKPIGTRFSAK